MQLNDLYPAPGSRKNRKRVGRGNSGKGGTTAGRGQKGQKSRSGGGKGGSSGAVHMKFIGRNDKRVCTLDNHSDIEFLCKFSCLLNHLEAIIPCADQSGKFFRMGCQNGFYGQKREPVHVFR